eukprot:scaffold89045_cov18-Phaeocystis_antarctica.AAC.1
MRADCPGKWRSLAGSLPVFFLGGAFQASPPGTDRGTRGRIVDWRVAKPGWPNGGWPSAGGPASEDFLVTSLQPAES